MARKHTVVSGGVAVIVVVAAALGYYLVEGDIIDRAANRSAGNRNRCRYVTPDSAEATPSGTPPSG